MEGLISASNSDPPAPPDYRLAPVHNSCASANGTRTLLIILVTRLALIDCRIYSSVMQQPGSARMQTIMISLGSPTLPATEFTRHSTVRPGDWRDEAWRWNDAEIRRLEALLSGETFGQGDHLNAGPRDPIGPLIQGLLEAPNSGETMRRLFGELLRNDRLVDAFVEVEGASQFSSVVELARQRKGARSLHAVINNPVSTEEQLRSALRQEWWVFGGHFIPPVRLERIPVLEQVDLPLIRSDRAIHIVAIGPANVPDIVVPAADGYRVGPPVLDIVNRAIHQLLDVDAQHAAIRDVLGVESRRAFATVVIGHPAYTARLPRDELRNTLRTYSSHLAGLEILTYQQLMDSVERSLDLLAGDVGGS